jgi:alanine dehydrogenase
MVGYPSTGAEVGGMIIGVPREIKPDEYRVALTPTWAQVLVEAGHTVLIQATAGEGSGFTDEEYVEAGAIIRPSAADIYASCEMLMKVKEPIAPEYELLRPESLLFCFLHLAAEERLTQTLLERRITSIAYETVQLPDGSLPLLAPMSEVAGRMAVQVGAHYLERHNGGRGKLLGGVTGVLPCNVIILGGGTVGTNSAQIALGMGANVTIIDRNVDRLRFLSEFLGSRLMTLVSNGPNIAEAVETADLLVGAVLVPGGRAPKLVSRKMLSRMRKGSVIVDVAVDQGGCIETARPTTHKDPVYEVDGILHYGVANMPGAVPHTSTHALSNVTLPYALQLANLGFSGAIAQNPALAKGVNTMDGQIMHPAVAEAFRLPLGTMLVPASRT